MTLRRMWILSAVMAAFWCGLLAVWESHLDIGYIPLFLIFGIGGELALVLTDPIRPMLGLGQRGIQPLDHLVFYTGDWIFMCIVFFLTLLGHRKLKRLSDRRLKV